MMGKQFVMVHLVGSRDGDSTLCGRHPEDEKIDPVKGWAELVVTDRDGDANCAKCLAMVKDGRSFFDEDGVELKYGDQIGTRGGGIIPAERWELIG